MPLCRCCHSRLPSTGMSSMDVESPGIPFSLNAEVWWASNDICADMSCRSTEPSNSSITGIIDTIIMAMIESTPPNMSTVATAAETACSSR